LFGHDDEDTAFVPRFFLAILLLLRADDAVETRQIKRSPQPIDVTHRAKLYPIEPIWGAQLAKDKGAGGKGI